MQNRIIFSYVFLKNVGHIFRGSEYNMNKKDNEYNLKSSFDKHKYSQDNSIFNSLYAPLEYSFNNSVSSNIAEYVFNQSVYENPPLKNTAVPSNAKVSSVNDKDILDDDTPIMEETKTTEEKEKKQLIFEGFRSLANLDIHRVAYYFRNARLHNMKDEVLTQLYNTTVIWIEKLNEVRSIKNTIKKGDFLMKSWLDFQKKQSDYKALNNHPYLNNEHLDKFMNFVITLAYTCYKNALHQQPVLRSEPEFKLKIYRCLKMLKEYKEALALIQGLCSQYSNSGLLYSELADCYYLTKNINNSKLIFREVFYKYPQEVNLETIETPFIHEIVKEIKTQMRHPVQYINYWIPIYGYINHTFSITRELKPIEFHNIQNDISNMEAKLEDIKALGDDDEQEIVPMLLNRFFWMIDFYKKTGTINTDSEKKSRIQILYNKIKEHDPPTYQLLTSV